MGGTPKKWGNGCKLTLLVFCVIATAAFARAAPDLNEQSDGNTNGEAAVVEETPVRYHGSFIRLTPA